MRCSLRLKLVLVATIPALSFATSALAQSPADPDPRVFLNKARASIVVITAEKPTGEPMPPGVGFFVGRNLIATDVGVFISARRVLVQRAGEEQKIDVSPYDNNRLVSILTAARTDGPALILGDSDKVAVNDKVFMLEYSNQEGVLSEATIMQLGTPNDPRCFQISKPISSSSRGGPVFNRKGEVIGIAGENLAGQGIVMPVSYLAILLTYVTGPGVGTGIGVDKGAGVGPPSLGPGSGESQIGASSNPSAPSTSVDVMPVPLNNVAPHYTEEARTHRIQGVVLMRVLVGEDGQVKQVSIVRGLPDGLDEQAVAAARQLRFKPAMKNGQAVSHWVPLQLEFKLR